MENQEEPNYNPFTNGPVKEMKNYKPKKKTIITKPKPKPISSYETN
jgi:hypothetical protein